MRVGDLEIVPEDLVEPDLERGNPGPLALALLQRGDVLLSAVPEVAALVELRVVAPADDATIRERHRRPRLERGGQFLGQVGEEVESLLDLDQCRAPLAAREPAEPFEHVRQPEERIPERAQIARGRAAGRGPAGEPLHVAHAFERLAEPGPPPRILHQRLHRVEPLVDPGGIAKRREQPGTEHSRAHRRHGRVDRLEQGDAAGSGAKRLDQLEIPAGHLVEPQMIRGAAHGRSAQVLEPAGLQLGEIAKQGTGGADRGIVVGHEAQPVERREIEAPGQLLPREHGIELPALARGAHHAVLECEGHIGRHRDLGGRQAAERLGEGIGGEGLEQEFAGGEIGGGDANNVRG